MLGKGKQMIQVGLTNELVKYMDEIIVQLNEVDKNRKWTRSMFIEQTLRMKIFEGTTTSEEAKEED